ncbi:MAG: vanW2 [Eubacterium sp.]|jgi:vancomycin resistance protein YoaR|nr:vanW2 [Eubacterium sp.]
MKIQLNNKNALYGGFVIITILIIITCLIYYINGNRKLSYDYFYKGIYIDGVKVEGLTKKHAEQKIKRELESYYKQTFVKLLYNDKSWDIPLSEIEFGFDAEATVNRGYKLGRSGSWFYRLKTINRLDKKPINLIVSAKYDKVKLIKLLTKIKKEIDFSGSNSTYEYNYGRIVYTSDVSGRKFDLDTNTKLIEARLLNRDFSDVFLEVETVRPTITVDDVKDLKNVLGTFSTTFNSNNYSRAHNIELASKKINNFLLLPGEEFSMDFALGPRTSSNGYMQAPIIMRSRMVSGTGGGVCQVATTLYNAALLSFLEITMRVHHSIPLRYVPPGQDATISEGYIDLKFKNNRDYTICIVSEVKGGNVTIKIIGRKKDGENLRSVLRPVILDQYDPPEPEYVINNGLSNDEIQIRVKERKGLKVVLYRDTYNEQGKLVNSEVISEDIYKPVRGQLAVSRKTYDALKNN